MATYIILGEIRPNADGIGSFYFLFTFLNKKINYSLLEISVYFVIILIKYKIKYICTRVMQLKMTYTQ